MNPHFFTAPFCISDSLAVRRLDKGTVCIKVLLRQPLPCRERPYRSPQAGIGGSSIVGVSISKGIGANAPISVEIVTETAAGTNISWRYTEYIGNVKNKEDNMSNTPNRRKNLC